jgi:flagellar basal-body rod modification protein FlgD
MAIETVDVGNPGKYENTTRTPSTELGKNDFLLLLTEQLKNQDPMNPMDNTEYISQLSTFSELEQLQNMNTSLEKFTSSFSSNYKAQAMSFLGATVTAKAEDMLQPITGMVETVGFDNGEPYLKVGDYAFTLDEIQLASPTYIDTGSQDSVTTATDESV